MCVGVSNRRVSPYASSVLLPGLGEQLGEACLLGIGIWVMVDPTGFREDRGRQPPVSQRRLHPPGHGGLLFCSASWAAAGRPGEQVSAAVREYPMGALGRGWIEPCTHTKGFHTLGSEPGRLASRKREATNPAICIHAGPVPAAWGEPPQSARWPRPPGPNGQASPPQGQAESTES